MWTIASSLPVCYHKLWQSFNFLGGVIMRRISLFMKRTIACLLIFSLMNIFTGCHKNGTSSDTSAVNGSNNTHTETETDFQIGPDTSEYFSSINPDYSLPDQSNTPIVFSGMLSDTSVWALVVSDSDEPTVYLEQFDFDGQQTDVVELGTFSELDFVYGTPYMFEDAQNLYVVYYPSKDKLRVIYLNKSNHETGASLIKPEGSHTGEILGFHQDLIYVMNLNEQGALACFGYDISSGECRFQSKRDSSAKDYIWYGDHLFQLNLTSEEDVYQIKDLSTDSDVSYHGELTAPSKYGKFHYYNEEQYFDSDKGIWYLNKETGTWDNIILWDKSDADKTDPPTDLRIVSKNHDRFLACGPNMKKIYLFKAGKDPSAGKTTLQLVGQDFPNDVVWAIQKFNTDNSRYVIEYKTFEELVDPNNYLDQDGWIDTDAYDEAVATYFWKAIRDGEGPDMLLHLSGSGSKYDSRFYEYGGLLQDLSPMWENEDPSWKDQYYTNLFNSMKNGDALYSIPYNFEMTNYAISGNEKAAANIAPTYSEWLKYMDAHADGRVLLQMTGQDFLRECLIFDSASFIDKDSHTPHFSSSEFKDLLRLSKEYCLNMDEWNNGNFRETVLSKNRIGGQDCQEIIEEYCYASSGPFYGVISKDGGHAAFSCTSISVTSNCKDVNAAWEFIKLLLSSDVQEYSLREDNCEHIIRSFFPVRKSSVDYLLDFEMNPKDHEEYWKYYNSDIEEEWSIDMMTPMTKEEAQKVHDFISAVDYAYYSDIEIINVIMEETAPYFADQKSLDDVVTVIDNRIRTLLRERQ